MEEDLVYALALMYDQYCTGPSGHQNMRAGENAEAILEGYGLVNEGELKPNWEQLLTSPKQEKPKVQQCIDEVTEVLKKYNCRIICEPRDYYGQTVWVPVFDEIKKQ